MKRSQKRGSEVSCYIALETKKSDTFRENTWLTSASVRARKVRLWTPRRWKKGKALPREMPPERGRRGRWGTRIPPGQPRAAWQVKLGTRNWAECIFLLQKMCWGRSFRHSPVQTLYIILFSVWSSCTFQLSLWWKDTVCSLRWDVWGTHQYSH